MKFLDTAAPATGHLDASLGATRAALRGLTPRGVEEAARRLRKGIGERPLPRDIGVTLGRLEPRGPVLRASWEDVVVAGAMHHLGHPDEPLPRFDPAAFVESTDALYLLSKDGGASAAPFVAALTDAVLQTAVRAAERHGGRLPVPLVAALDEAANIVRIGDLPALYSHLGSRGVVPITVLQSYSQAVGVWGESGAKTLWGAATVKLLGAGIDDASFAEDVSRLVGDHDVPTTSTASGGGKRTRTTSTRRDRVLSAAQIRALPKGRSVP